MANPERDAGRDAPSSPPDATNRPGEGTVRRVQEEERDEHTTTIERSLGLTGKQKAKRRLVLGGTDAVAIFGLSHRWGPWDVWAEKVGTIEPAADEPSEAALWGLLVEPVVRAEYQRRAGIRVRKPSALIRNPERRWQGGHLDGIGDDRLLEIKLRRDDSGWGEPGTDEIPPDVKLQVEHYLAVTGLPRADVAVLFRGQRLDTFVIYADEAQQRDLNGEEGDWWQRHVVEGEQPPFDGDSTTTRALRRRWPRSDARELVALPHQYAVLEGYARADAAVDDAEKERERIKQVIMATMEDASTLLAPGIKVSWRGYSREVTDWKTYAADLEGLIERMAVGELPVTDDPLTVRDTLRGLHSMSRSERRFTFTQKRKEIT